MKTVKNKRFSHKDYPYWITEGLAPLLPIELPQIESLPRGVYEFVIDKTHYQLYEGTYRKTLHNRWGGAYGQEQKCYGVKCIKGKDIYGLECNPTEYYSSKKSAIQMIDGILQNRIYTIAREKGIEKPERAEYKDFLEEFEKQSKDDQIAILKKQVRLMARGYDEEDALAKSCGWANAWQEGCIGILYVPYKYFDKVMDSIPKSRFN